MKKEKNILEAGQEGCEGEGVKNYVQIMSFWSIMHFLSALHCGCGVCVCVFQVESYYGIGDKISDLIEGTGNLTET